MSVTEQLVRTLDPNSVTKASSHVDTRLPIGASVLSVFQSLESFNTIPKNGEIWRVPKDFTVPKTQERTGSYRHPVPDPNSGLDFSKIPIQDPDVNKLLLNIPSSSKSVSVPYSILEIWENRERRVLGLSNQIDLMLATILRLVCEWSDSVPDELRDLLIHLSGTTLNLSHNAASSMSEMLRIRRDLILSSIPKKFLLEPGLNSLRTAPLSSGFLFGGKIQEALSADKDDQLHASLARNNSKQQQVTFKRPASRPPPGPIVKKDKMTNLFSQKPSWNSRSGSNRSNQNNLFSEVFF
ncbi:hypothetical protein DPMN_027338 [Dreissena polymorpha]|uniref:Uncharacterized protein n=1 Tax=Dreissena polymorpha TaxID=45954 RepID=A0A9D4LUK0_DREPO|nr:hypothetical protein DPMN_027338 [Dreissena polymorpha]